MPVMQTTGAIFVRRQKAAAGESIKSPVLPPGKLLQTRNEMHLRDETEFADFYVSQADCSGQAGAFVVIHSGRMDRVRLSNCELRKLRVKDVVWDKSDLSNTDLSETKITRAEFVDCKLTGLKVIDGDILDTKFLDCVGLVVQFQGTTFKNVLFENCKFSEVDFRFCNLEGAVFHDCDLRGAIFYDTKLAGTDFRGSELGGIKAHAQDWKGAILGRQQAADMAITLAHSLEIEVKDD